jgi:hypothetical protein
VVSAPNDSPELLRLRVRTLELQLRTVAAAEAGFRAHAEAATSHAEALLAQNEELRAELASSDLRTRLLLSETIATLSRLHEEDARLRSWFGFAGAAFGFLLFRYFGSLA